MKEKLAKLLQDLPLLNGLPGQEQPVVRYLRDAFAPFADEVKVGVNGNIYARKKGKKPGMTVAASQEFAGLPAIFLGIPIRYSHAPSSVRHLTDMESCLQLAEP